MTESKLMEMEFTVREIHNITEIEQSLIRKWMYTGKLINHVNEDGAKVVTGADLCDFLYFNKRYTDSLDMEHRSSYITTMREAILDEIRSREPIYSAVEISEMLDASDQYIRDLIRNGTIKWSGYMNSQRSFLVYKHDLEEFMDRRREAGRPFGVYADH